MADARDAVPSSASGATSTVARVFEILDAFRGEMVLGARAIARRTGLPASTVHRIAGQLADLGALSRVGTSYRLGPRVFEVGALHYPAELRAALHPFLVDLQRSTGCDVSMLEMTGRSVLVVDHVPARHCPCPLVKVGARLPAHATAGGKAIMASSSRIPFERDSDLVALTPRTLRTLAALVGELERARSSGVAFDHGESDPGTKGVAAPVLNRQGQVLGALMASSAAPGFDPESAAVAVATLARALTRVGAATNISFYAGLRPPRRGPETGHGLVEEGEERR